MRKTGKYGVPSKIDGKPNPEYARLQYQATKDRAQARLQAYRQANKERICEYNKAYRVENKESVREYQNKYALGAGYETMRVRAWRTQNMSIDTYGQFLTLLAIANYKCEICQCDLAENDAHLDHEHSNGKVRGILCERCNRGLGCFRDSYAHVLRAVAYMRES